MKYLVLLLVLTACSGGDFNVGMAITHDSGTPVLDSMRGGDAATAGDISPRVALTDGAEQYGDSGRSSLATSHPDGAGGSVTGDPIDSGESPTWSDATLQPRDADGGSGVASSDAQPSGTGGAPACGMIQQRCPCCHGLTCQIGYCL